MNFLTTAALDIEQFISHDNYPIKERVGFIVLFMFDEKQ